MKKTAYKPLLDIFEFFLKKMKTTRPFDVITIAFSMRVLCPPRETVAALLSALYR